MTTNMLGLLGGLLVTAQLAAGGTDPLDQWQWRNPLPNGNSISGLTFADGQFLAVSGGAVASSLDGTNWITHNCGPVDTAGTTYGLGSVTYGNGTFVAAGSGRTPGADGSCGVVFTSTNGVDWVAQPKPADLSDIASVVYGNGLFVAAAGSTGADPTVGGYILTSPDGVQWTPVFTRAGIQVLDWPLFYVNGEFFLPAPTSGAMTGTLFTSTDGVDWAYEYLSPWFFGSSGVAFGNGTYVLVGGNALLTSMDGQTWTKQASGSAASPNSVAYGNGLFVTVGIGVFSSPDAQKWTRRTSGASQTLSEIAYGNGVFVADGSSDVVVSTNGINWQSLNSSITTDGLIDVAYGGGRFVAVGGDGMVLGSPDGSHWTKEISATNIGLSALAVGGGTWVAVGYDGAVVRSTNGVDWETADSGTTSFLMDIAYGQGLFVAVGDQGTVLTSANGTNWVSGDTGINEALWKVAYGNGTFVVSGASGEVAVSTNGVDWSQGTSGTDQGFSGMAWGNGVFVGTDSTNGILLSINGLDWNPGATGPLLSWLGSVRFGHGTFVAVGRSGTIMTSTNGVDWVNRNSGTGNGLLAVAYGNGTFVTVGYGGTILQSAQLADTLLTLGPVTPLANGTVAVTVNGALGDTWQIQASTNLVDWAPLTSVTITNVPMQFFDQGATSLNRRFYRGFNPN